MKKTALLIVSIFMLAGCAGFQLENTPTGNSIGYFAGKGVGVAVNEITPAAVPELEAKFDEFTARTIGLDMIPPDESIKLFNDLTFVLSKQANDPYGLLNDLTFLMGQFGAQFKMEGEQKIMTGIQPIPRAVYLSFESGYDSGKWMVENALND